MECGRVGDPVLGRVDTDGSVVTATAAPTATTINVRSTNGPAWIDTNDRLNPNPDFESGLAGWSPSAARLDRVPTPADAPFGGHWSMQLTPIGTPTQAYVQSDLIQFPSSAVIAHAFLKCKEACPYTLNINWFTTSKAYISTSSATSGTLTAGVWKEAVGEVTSPPNAAYASIIPTMTGNPTRMARSSRTSCTCPHRRTRTPISSRSTSRWPAKEMTVSGITDAVRDTFTRTVVNAWGSPEVGTGPWVCSGAAADFNVTNGTGAEILPTPGNTHYALTPAPGRTWTCTWTCPRRSSRPVRACTAARSCALRRT